MNQMLAAIARRLGNLLARGTVVMANSANRMQTLQIRLATGEVQDNIEQFEAYGLTAHPKAGAEHLTVYLGGERGHGVTVVVADRRYRLKSLAEGEVALYDDLGQKVHLKRTGIVVDGAGNPITLQNASHIDLNAANVNVSGNLNVNGNIVGQHDVTDSAATTPKTMAGMRLVFNTHTHPETGTNTQATSTPM